MKSIQGIRGFNDIYENIERWQALENILSEVADQYAYEEIRTPYCESTTLFERSIGVTSDIVHKEMYTFVDKNEQSISLRPEGTASVVRACIEKNLLYDQTRKFYYMGSMFRRERPQKGRLRQFNQFGMECLGYTEPYPDTEQLIIVDNIWKRLNISTNIKLELNYLGSRETRLKYGKALKDYYSPFREKMSELNQKRLSENTLRLLDSKDEFLIEINKSAPTIAEYYTEEEHRSFQKIQEICDSHGIIYQVNPTLMRGLDYYTGLIYEWKSDELGAQSTICGGGRYDLLFENLGQKAQPACGFSIGIERLIELIKDQELRNRKKTIAMVAMHEKNIQEIMQHAEKIRKDCRNVKIHTHFEHGKLQTMIKKALKKKAQFIILHGENEIKSNTFTIKNLKTKDQKTVDYEGLIKMIRRDYD